MIKTLVDRCNICDKTNDKSEAMRWKRRWQSNRTALFTVWDTKHKRALI